MPRTGPSAQVVRSVRERDHGRCRRCGAPGTNTQHRVGRGMGGTSNRDINDMSNLVTVCGSGTTGCHGHITEHPAEAYATGWAIRRSNPDLPSEIPLTALDGHQFFLTEDGGVVDLPRSTPMALFFPDDSTNDQLRRALESLLAGQTIDRVVSRHDGDGLDLRKFARSAGAPNRTAMREALTRIDVERPGGAPLPPDLDTTNVTDSEVEVEGDEPPAEDAQPAETVGAIEQLVARGHRSTRPSTRRCADRLEKSLTDLLHALETDRVNEHREHKIAELRAQLDALRKPKTTSTTAVDPSQPAAKTVRAWANASGVTVGDHGRIPQHVIDQYLTAQDSA